jgi:CheY-like chemotaxis protein
MRLRGARVLLVDDFADSAELYQIALGLEGADVTAVATAAHALAALDGAPFDALVSDLVLSEVDGYTLVRSVRAREIERGGKIPAIALTGHAYPHHRAAAYEAGFDRFLAKPCSPSTLVETLGEVLSGPAAEAAPDERAPSLHGVRVLAVDDHEADLYLMQRALAACGAEVTTVGSGDEAIAALPIVRPHVLVTDILMPTGSGYDLLRRVRELPKEQGGQIPAVAVTILASNADRAAALASGFADHLTKPFDADRLVSLVASLAASAT